jgi:hypothetical protein
LAAEGGCFLLRAAGGKVGATPVANHDMSPRRSPAVPPLEPTIGVAWRRDRLLAAGFGRDEAAALARDSRIDLHALLELVDRGCPPALAARIAAPLDDVREP